jgi:hypothetical protein
MSARDRRMSAKAGKAQEEAEEYEQDLIHEFDT